MVIYCYICERSHLERWLAHLSQAYLLQHIPASLSGLKRDRSFCCIFSFGHESFKYFQSLFSEGTEMIVIVVDIITPAVVMKVNV